MTGQRQQGLREAGEDGVTGQRQRGLRDGWGGRGDWAEAAGIKGGVRRTG